MALLAVPIGLFSARRYNALALGFGFTGLGFLFFVTERIMLSMGISGVLPGFLAVWAPILIFGTVTLWYIMLKQD